MISFFPDPQTVVAFRIGSLALDIRWYAVLILIGAAIAYVFCKRFAKESRYIDMSYFDDLFIYTLWFGIMGARLWFCVFYNFSYYLAHPVEIIRVWDGGLAIQGGLVFGALFAYWFITRKHYPFMKLMDILLPNVLIGQAIGRWGNFVNQECHGGEVAESYFDGFLSFLKEGMYIDGHYYEPLFFYESMLCLIGWLLIVFVLRKHQNKRGDLAYAYLMWYGIGRFFIEARRTDSLYLGNLKMAQVTSLLFILIGVLGYLGVLDKLFKKAKPVVLFDFDGTLIDTSEGIYEGYRYLFEKYSDPSKFTPEVKQEVIGPALRDLFPKYFPGIDYDTLYADYKKRQSEVMPKTIHPMPHCEEVLKYLHDNGYKVGIISTRSSPDIRNLLGMFDLEQYVDEICGLHEVEKLKPDPEGIFKMINDHSWNKDCILVGDSKMDILGGLNYGAYTVAYLSDPERSQELSALANESITDLEELLDILKKDISFTYDRR
ncbi:MAG: prolipoprotein diacylglyceryl transferase [Erysipelotrichaceae bacterium]|nr:prolipoprotein diacylglyceryl transferase [Erysipelotrichaceae bacterium]